MNKQIEEMADILCDAKEHDCKGGNDCLCVKQAEALYKESFRKSTDVAREIFAEIESKMIFVKDHTGRLASVVRFADILELKKKYESEGGE